MSTNPVWINDARINEVLLYSDSFQRQSRSAGVLLLKNNWVTLIKRIRRADVMEYYLTA